MPNHCNNTIFVKGENVQILKALLAKVNERPNHTSQLAEAVMPMPESESDNWYDWCCNNWGNKWGDYDSFLEEDRHDGYAQYKFSTAWCPFEELFLEALAKEIPDFTYHYSEFGCDFAGIIEYVNGELNQHDDFLYLDGLIEQEAYDELLAAVEWQLEELEDMDETEADLGDEMVEALRILRKNGFLPHLDEVS